MNSLNYLSFYNLSIIIILQNTRQFLQNLPANDVLLTGSRGTGK
ncbi:DUF815 domain-containing protein, partial [Acinetobacter baumannii]